jgi:hypothetical protein
MKKITNRIKNVRFEKKWAINFDVDTHFLSLKANNRYLKEYHYLFTKAAIPLLA